MQVCIHCICESISKLNRFDSIHVIFRWRHHFRCTLEEPVLAVALRAKLVQGTSKMQMHIMPGSMWKRFAMVATIFGSLLTIIITYSEAASVTVCDGLPSAEAQRAKAEGRGERYRNC